MKYEPVIYWGFLCTKKADRCSEGIKRGADIFPALLPVPFSLWTCCSSSSCPRGVRSCLATLYPDAEQSSRHISVPHMPAPLQQAPPTGLPPLLFPFFLDCTGHVGTWMREGALSALPEFPVAPSGGTGAGGGEGTQPRDWQQAGRGPAFGVGDRSAAVGARAAS